MVSDRNPVIVAEFGAFAAYVHPARRNANLVVAQHVMCDAVAIRTAIRPRVFQRRREFSPQQHVERDRRMLAGLQPQPDRLEGFDDFIVNWSHVGARWIRRQPPSRPHSPLLVSTTDTGCAVEHTAVGVFADSEDDLQAVVAGMRHRPNLLRP